MEREAIRVQQPDGSFKVIFREKSKMPGNHEAKPEVKQESREKPRKERKEKPQDPRYFNPLNPEHIDIFGKDLLNNLFMACSTFLILFSISSFIAFISFFRF